MFLYGGNIKSLFRRVIEEAQRRNQDTAEAIKSAGFQTGSSALADPAGSVLEL